MQAVSAQEDDALELSQPFQALALSTGERTPYAESEYSAPLHNDSYSKSADQQPCVSDHDSDNPAVRGSCYTMRTTTEYTVNNRYSQGNNMPGHGPGSDTSGPSDRSIGGLPGGSMRVSWDT